MTTPDFHHLSIAGAGCGKTHSLVENYCKALFGLDASKVKKRPHEILALTFTEKAAHEMRTRIAERLSLWLSDQKNDDDLLKEALAEDRSLPKREDIEKILRLLPQASITTFHAFASSLLRSYARFFHVHEQFSIMSPHEEEELSYNVLRPLVLAKLKETPALKKLIIRFRLSPGLFSRGLFMSLIDCYNATFEAGMTIESLTRFTQRARLKKPCLNTLLDSLVEASNDFLLAKNSEATTLRLTTFLQEVGHFRANAHDNEDEVALSFGRLKALVKGNFGDKVLRQRLVQALDRLAVFLVDQWQEGDEDQILALLLDFHNALSSAKKRLNKLSYGDLLRSCRDGLRDNLSLRSEIKQRFLHIMVDEYQDTSPIQEEIIALLSEDKLTSAVYSDDDDILAKANFKNGASLFVVGDKKQSIYGFRGAHSALFDKMAKKMANTHGESGFFRDSLRTNRRSFKKILDLVNFVSASALYEQNYQEADNLEPFLAGEHAKLELWLKKEASAQDKNSENLICAADGIAHALATDQTLKASDICALTRRVRAAERLKRELFKRGIDARVYGGEGFFQKQEIVEIIAALTLLLDPSDPWASLTVFRSYLVLVPDNDLLTILIESAEEKSVNLLSATKALQAEKLSPGGSERLALFLRLLTKMREKAVTQGLAEAIDCLIAETDYAHSLGLCDAASDRLRNVAKLRSICLASRETFAQCIDSLKKRVERDFREPLAPNAELDDAVRIMTMHQSKGLEFKAVVILDSESTPPRTSHDFIFNKELGLAVMPKNRPISSCLSSTALTRYEFIKKERSNKEDDEIARLLYVAMTRAKEHLYIVSSRESYQEKNPKNSLLGLILQARNKNPEKFAELIKIQPIESFVPAIKKAREDKQESSTLKLYTPTILEERLFASELQAQPEPLEHWVSAGPSLAIDGNRAHKIMQRAGQAILAMHEPDRETMLHIVNAAMRSLGYDPHNQDIKNACLVSLKLLKDLSTDLRQAIFEMPLISRPCDGAHIEGFADLVMDFDKFLAVVEFKASARLASSPETLVQVLAYAHALKDLSEKPIYYARMQIGSPKKLRWQLFGDEDQAKYLASVRASLLIS